MRVGIFSDLHLEFAPWDVSLDPDVLYLNAGDTHPDPIERTRFYSEKKINHFYALGNHDYYGHEFPAPDHGTATITTGDLKFVVATLWTDLNPVEFIEYRETLADGRWISGLTHEKYSEKHRHDLRFIVESDADVVVTHHTPSMRSCHPKWGASTMNRMFHNSLDEVILSMKKPPKIWVHGHTHSPCWYYLNTTLVVCYPRGYPREENHDSYSPLYIDLDNLPKEDIVRENLWRPYNYLNATS